MNMKRIATLLLALCLVFSMIPATVFAVETETSASVDNGNITVEGTNGVGVLLSEEISEYQEETAETTTIGYNVIGLEIVDGVATATFRTIETATLVVALYTEDGMQLLLSGNAQVEPEDTSVQITLEGDMPEYFMASAYLVDHYDYSPLCAAYETPMYTQEMQELLAATVEDYDADKVLNLDDDNATNFAVYADDTILIEEQEGVNTVASLDDETATYVIENADESITSLQAGDIFAYPYGDNEILIVKVATITIDSTTATITGADLEMEEAFSHVKIESAGSTEDFVVDESTGDESISYVGTVTEEATPAVRSHEADISGKLSLGFKLEKETEYGKIEGSLTTNLSATLSYYISTSRQFLEFKLDTQTKFALNVSGKQDIPLLKLPNMGFSPVPGVYIGCEPEVVLQISASIEFSVTVSTVSGFSYENGKGVTDLSTAPKVECSVEIEGTIFIGIDLGPRVKILGGWVAEVKLKALAGVELKAKMTGTKYDDVLLAGEAEAAESTHMCESCIEISLYAKKQFSVALEFLNLKFLEVSFKLTSKVFKIGDFYYSLDDYTFGKGKCPNKNYRVSVYVHDAQDLAASGAEVTLTYADQTTRSFGTTNMNGVVVDYLPAGTYGFSSVVDGMNLGKAVEVEEACKIILDRDTIHDGSAFILGTESITDNGIIASGECGADGDNVTWTLYGSGLLQIQGSGEMHSFATNKVPWIDYKLSITSVEIKEGVTNIGSNAFYMHENLNSITLPASVSDIGVCAFCSCSSLISVTIPDSVTSIGDSAFSGCDGLTEITIPDSVISIGNGAFSNCYNLAAVKIGKGVKTIDEDAFRSCYNLTDIHVTDIRAWCGISFASIYSQPMFENDNSCLYFNGSLVSELIIPEGITSISSYAFRNCECLVSVTIPEGVSHVDLQAFAYCENLSSVVLPTSLIRIGVQAFTGCKLTSITIPDGVTTIDTGAFQYCSSLKTILVPDSVTMMGSGAFADTAWYNSQPNGMVYIGKVAYGYKGTCPSEIVINAGTLSIRSSAFYYEKGLTSVTIPDSVTSIGSSAFAHCTGLTSIEIPDSVTYIGSSAFYHCDGLTSVTIPSCTTSFDSAFAWCSGLTSVTFLENITYIDRQAFHGCTSLTSVVLPDSVTVIGERAFGSSGLTSVTIPDNVTAINEWAFSFCDNLTEIDFEGNAPTMKSNTFSDIIATAYYPAGNETWTSDVMQGYGGTITWVPYTLGENGEIVPVETATVAVASEEAVSLMATQTEETETTETETTTTSKPATKSVWSGDYTTEITDTYVLKTASFSGLVAGKEYVLLSLASIEAEEILAPDNLLYIDQAAAAEDGTLVFQYVQRVTTDTSYVVACGASDQDLSEAVITFPEMTADGELHVVDPTVVYNDVTLTEGVDYTIVGVADYTEAGTYTCYIRGIRDYTGLVECTYTVAEAIELFDLAGMTMSLGNSLAANFVVMNSNLDGDGYYAVITKVYANSDPVTVTIPMDQWSAYGTVGKYFTFSGVTAKEMTDVITVDVYNADGVQVMNTYTRTIEDYCYQQLVKEEALASPNAENLALYTDILKYGAAAQNYFDGYNADNLATARLTEAQLAYGTQEVTMTDIRVKGTGYMGSTLSLKSEISMNFVFANATIDQAAYATISFTDHYKNLKETTVLSADFVAYGTAGKYIVVDGMGVADCSAPITVTLYDADGNVLSTNVDSVEAYIARMSGADEVYPAILKLATSAYNYFH